MKLLVSSAILLFNNDSVLLNLRSKSNPVAPSVWTIPGGLIHKNETPLQTAVRELKEETDYSCNNPKFFTKAFHLIGLKYFVISNVYVGKYDNTQKIKCLEGDKLEFIPLKQAVKLPTLNKFSGRFYKYAYNFYKKHYNSL